MSVIVVHSNTNAATAKKMRSALKMENADDWPRLDDAVGGTARADVYFLPPCCRGFSILLIFNLSRRSAVVLLPHPTTNEFSQSEGF